jgi:acylglycerol lipase
MKMLYILLLPTVLAVLSGCMPAAYPPGAKTGEAQLHHDYWLAEDGAKLPLRTWLPKSEANAVLIALHGFNDYSNFFQKPGEYFSSHGIACYAYDQRGFGAAPQRGLWAGVEGYTHDLRTLAALLRQRYPQRPVYLLGESMGGAVVIAAMKEAGMPPVDGIILAAPAVWARDTMPWYQTGLLWTLAHTMPWLSLTGSSIKVHPSDNIEMLRALGRDPLVIKETRVDAIYGLADLMDAAFDGATSLRGNTLMLYGEKDDIVPKEPTYAFLQQFLAKDATGKTVAIYSQGYHMLLRDLEAPKLWQDIVAWITARPTKLPSGADERARQLLAQGIRNGQSAIE